MPQTVAQDRIPVNHHFTRLRAVARKALTPPEQVPNPLGMTSLCSFGQYLASVGVSPTTGWRWRQQGRIETVNIDGRLFVTEDAIAKFEKRAAAGEFSSNHKTPAVEATV